MYGTIVQSGSFTSDGNAQTLQIRSDVDWVVVRNFTQAGTTQSTGRGVEFWWQRGMDNNSAFMYTKQDSLNALDLETITSGGISLIDSSNLAPEAAQTGTAVNQADPAQVTINGHGYSNGDVVRVYSTTGMLQIAGMEFTIGSVATNTFELSYLDSSGFAAAATAVTARRLPFEPIFFPRNRYITNITAASSAVITLSVDHNYSVGELVRVQCNSDFGMEEIDGLLGEITAVSSANNTITVDIDSSNFTAFSFPTSATAGSGVTFPQVVPVGDASGSTGATDNQAFIGLKLAAGNDSPAGNNNDVIYWVAGKSEVVSN